MDVQRNLPFQVRVEYRKWKARNSWIFSGGRQTTTLDQRKKKASCKSHQTLLHSLKSSDLQEAQECPLAKVLGCVHLAGTALLYVIFLLSFPHFPALSLNILLIPLLTFNSAFLPNLYIQLWGPEKRCELTSAYPRQHGFRLLLRILLVHTLLMQ